MVLLTAVSFEKSVYQQEETIRGPSFSLAPLNSGHVDVDIEQYEAPTDGRREDYICRFRAYGQFSFQQPEFRKSTMPLWKRGRDKIASWQSFVVRLIPCFADLDRWNELRILRRFQRLSLFTETWASEPSAKHSLQISDARPNASCLFHFEPWQSKAGIRPVCHNDNTERRKECCVQCVSCESVASNNDLPDVSTQL